MTNKWFGCRRDLRDARDHEFEFSSWSRTPKAVDLREYCPPPMDQGALGCHDDKTEVLTADGWRFFSDLDGNERLATVNPETSELSFEAPTKLLRFPYKGPMIVGQHRFLDFCVTPNHRMLVRKWSERHRTLESEYRFVDASKLGWYCGLMNRVKWNGASASDIYTLPAVELPSQQTRVRHKSPRDVPMVAWLRFVGIYLAEGTMRLDKGNYGIQLAAVKEREKTFIKQTLFELGIRALEFPDRFAFTDQQIGRELDRLGLRGVKAGKKFVPRFVFRQSADMIREFLAGHFAGDGCLQYNRAHYTSSSVLCDDLQTLIFMSGDESFVSVREARSSVMADGRTVIGVLPEHRISVCENKNLSIERSEQIGSQDYDGNVFCAEVPSFHTLVTRRNGSILISGNSCVANAVTGVLRYALLRAGESDVHLSRLQLYYDGRRLEGTVNSDSGIEIRDGIKCVAKLGVGHEKLWPYKVSRFRDKPTAKVYTDALGFRALEYERVAVSITALRHALALGFPVVVGLSLYSSFESDAAANTGLVPMPDLEREQMIGGHCMYATGYNQRRGYFTVRNSWGSTWGEKGDCFIPYAYLGSPKLSSDFWIVRTEGAAVT